MDKERGMKMILTTTGCYGTGSSAVTDIVKEIEGVTCVSDNEIRLLHDPDGVSDLEYSLIENPNRHNSSQSVKRFKKRMQEMDHILFVNRFNRYFGDGFMNVIDKYIDHITLNKYKGAWHYDVYDRGKLFYVFSRTYAKITKVLSRILHKPISELDPVSKKEIAYLTITDEQLFLKATQELVDDLAGLVNKDNNRFVFIDQLVPPSNFERFIRYVSDVRIVLVERDPRDVYLLEKEVWKGSVAPVENVEDFCKWYQWTRNLCQKERFPKQVLFLQFEDLIFNYEETRNKILHYFGIDHLPCKRQKEFFDPQVSVVNTQLWKKIRGYEEDIKYIENNLEQYCYNFSKYDDMQPKVNQKMF